MIEKSAVIAWRSRWVEVNEQTARESLGMSPAERLRALARLRAFEASAPVAGWPDEEDEVWARFAQLRTLYRARRADR